jgi:branched-chain amino acid transport system permease protein
VQLFLQLFVAGIALGAIYALVALGFVVIYRASQVFNFAHGEFLMFGAFLMVSLVQAGLPWIVALAATMAGTGLLGMGVERAVLRPMIGKPIFVTIILTIFIALVMRVAVIVIWGTTERGMPLAWDRGGIVRFAGAQATHTSLLTILAAVLALAAFYVMFQRSRIGVAMRATATDQEAALGMGIPVGRIFGSTWFIAGATAALAGIFLGMPPRFVDPNLGFIALRAFPAVILGGLQSPLGAVIGGLILGLLEVLSQGYVNPRLGAFGHNFHAVFPYIVMILVLMVRPYGLFGEKEVERV